LYALLESMIRGAVRRVLETVVAGIEGEVEDALLHEQHHGRPRD
jgi:hypothetical protein